MRRAGLLLSVAIPVLIQTAPAVAQESAIPEWTVETWLNRNDGLLETPERQIYGGYGPDWRNWIRPEDVPQDLRRRRINTNTVVAIDIDSSGRATGCRVARASTEPRLDALVCSLLTTRGHFVPRRPRPGEAVAATWGMQVYWRVLDREQIEERNRRTIAVPPAPRPPAPGAVPSDRRWPRFDWYGSLRPVALPDLQAAYPRRPGRPAEGMTSLDLVVDPASGVTECEIGISSGKDLLDVQACLTARTMRFAYAQPCDVECRPERLPLQFVWKRRGSHVRTPLLSEYSRSVEPIRDPADTRVERRSRATPHALPRTAPLEPIPADRSHSNRFVALRYTIDETGMVRNCTITESSGNLALDNWLCRGFFESLRFSPRTDVFGNPVAQEMTMRRNLGQPN
jgi:TonB family protein